MSIRKRKTGISVGMFALLVAIYFLFVSKKKPEPSVEVGEGTFGDFDTDDQFDGVDWTNLDDVIDVVNDISDGLSPKTPNFFPNSGARPFVDTTKMNLGSDLNIMSSNEKSDSPCCK